MKYNLDKIGSTGRSLIGLEKVVGPKGLTTEEEKEYRIATEVNLPYAKLLAKEGRDPSFYLAEVKQRSPINLDDDINKVINIYIRNFKPVSGS